MGVGSPTCSPWVHWQFTIAELLRIYPGFRDDTFHDASAIQSGRLVLPGTGGRAAQLSEPIDWFDNPTSTREFTWTLHRHRHWKSLLRAHLIDPVAGYGPRVVDELRGWMTSCPRPSLDLDRAQELFNGARRKNAGAQRVLRWLEKTPTLFSSLHRASRFLTRKSSRRAQPPDAWRAMEVGTRMFDSWPIV